MFVCHVANQEIWSSEVVDSTALWSPRAIAGEESAADLVSASSERAGGWFSDLAPPLVWTVEYWMLLP